MIGHVMVSTHGVDGNWPGGEQLRFTISDVAALGRQRRYADFVTRFLCRLQDGREVMIASKERSIAEQRWLTKMAKRIPFGGSPSRDCPEITTWSTADELSNNPSRGCHGG